MEGNKIANIGNMMGVESRYLGEILYRIKHDKTVYCRECQLLENVPFFDIFTQNFQQSLLKKKVEIFTPVHVKVLGTIIYGYFFSLDIVFKTDLYIIASLSNL